jgi:hypothetical protein
MAQAVRQTADAAISVVPANEASWDDLQAVFGTRGDPPKCQCQWFRTVPADWRSLPVEDRAWRLREQTGCGDPGVEATSGLVAYLDGEPVGWCALEPRSVYVHLLGSRVVWAGRDEDPADDGVWAVTAAAVDFARRRGARALEGYPMITQPGQQITWGELYVGSRNSFAAAGFAEISRPTARRVVMRIDF